MPWFGVKTLYRWKTKGSPVNIDEFYDPKLVLIEERVVLIRATDCDAAIQLAEGEARKYEAYGYTNPYGEKVSTEYLGCCNCYELSDEPGHEVEVFSRTELESKYRTLKSSMDSQLGRNDVENEGKLRRKFQNVELA